MPPRGPRLGPVVGEVVDRVAGIQAFEHSFETRGEHEHGGKHYEGLTPHDLRRAAASFAIASGASVNGLQSMLGHQSANQTLDRYAALWGDELDAVAERIDASRTANNSRPDRRLTVIALETEKRANEV